MGTQPPDREEIARRGQAYYDRQLRDQLEPEHIGEYVVLDINSGEYEVDEDEVAAIQRAKSRHPEGIFYILRVGHRASVRVCFLTDRKRSAVPGRELFCAVG